MKIKWRISRKVIIFISDNTKESTIWSKYTSNSFIISSVDRYLTEVATKISTDGIKLCLQLGVEKYEIDNIPGSFNDTENQRRNLLERARRATSRENEFFNKVKTALRECKRNDVIRKIDSLCKYLEILFYLCVKKYLLFHIKAEKNLREKENSIIEIVLENVADQQFYIRLCSYNEAQKEFTDNRRPYQNVNFELLNLFWRRSTLPAKDKIELINEKLKFIKRMDMVNFSVKFWEN